MGDGYMADKILLPNDDLNREHGLILRMMDVYVSYLEHGWDKFFVVENAKVFAKFGEYHSIQEEKYVFPVLRKEKKEVALIDHLIHEHEETKELHKNLVKGEINFHALADWLPSYHKHIGVEQSIIFPLFQDILDTKKYKEIGEKFEKLEKDTFRFGYEGVLGQVKSIEAAVAALEHKHHEEE